MKTMKALIVPQNSELANAIYEAGKRIAPAYMVWADTGERVTYPLPLNVKRERRYVEVYEWTKNFEDFCSTFPDNVCEWKVGLSSGWGSAVYVADENGNPKLYSENWDSSG